MRTITGREIKLRDPDPNQLCAFDVAHGLSHQGRYAGHTRRLYTIGEHCILASYLVPFEHALDALMHDAAETNINDLIQPLKRLLPQYKEVECIFEEAYGKAFGVNYQNPVVKKADQLMFEIETIEARHHKAQRETTPPDLPALHLSFWSPAKARKLFLRRYFFLTDKTKSANFIKQINAWWRERNLTLKFYLRIDFKPVQ